MDEVTGQKNKEKVLHFVIITLYAILVFIQSLMPVIIPITHIPDEVRIDFVRFQTVVIFGIVIGLIQLILCVECVIVAKKSGYLTQLVANIINILFVGQAFFLQREYSALPGIAVSLVSMIICSIIYRQYRKIDNSVNALQQYVFRDELTGIPNRKERVSAVSSLISGASRVPVFSLIMFDLDNFKMMNDSLGHQIGDTFLSVIVHNLKDFIKEPDSIGRMGGDEFLIIVQGPKTEKELEAYIENIKAIIHQPFYYKDHDIKMTASFGVVRYPKDSDTVSELLQQVEIALYRAKTCGKNKIKFFDEKMQSNLEHQLTLERKLDSALNNKELYIEFQPQYKIPSKELRGFEVLARWNSPLFGAISPVDFIALAEENGSIVQIGEWIMREACSAFVRFIKDYVEIPTLAINISVVQFREPDFLTHVKSIIRDTGIDPTCLEFEITESVCISSPATTKQILQELKDMGIRIAMDDFGTGYSSLSYLRLLPLDIVKIDKSFIDSIGTIPDDKNIVKTIIDMSHQLGLEVIAEGIETKLQLDYLERNGCDILQGNYLGRPVPMAAL